MPISTWYDYSISDQKMTVFTFKQQNDYNYQYLIGSLIIDDDIDNENNTSTMNSVINNKNNNNSNNETTIFIPLSWGNFSLFLDETHNNNNDLYITQWSQTNCVSLSTCFNNFFDSNNDSSLEYYIYTLVPHTEYFDINSEIWSNILDDPRDSFMIFICVLLAILIFTVMILIQEVNKLRGCITLGCLLLFIASYYLWIFILTVIPILFSLPYDMNDINYFDQQNYSLVYSIGNYHNIWWLFGVLLHGISCYLIIFLFILSCLIFGCILCINSIIPYIISKIIVLSFITVLLINFILISCGYIIIFVVNCLMWNDYTYNVNTNNNDNNMYVIESLIGLGCVFILIPLYGCLMLTLSDYIKSDSTSNKFSNLQKRFSKVPIIGNYNYHDVDDDDFAYPNETNELVMIHSGEQQNIVPYKIY